MRLTAALLMSAGVLTGLGTAAASAATCQLGGQPPSPGTVSNELIGVAEVSACNVWAVGDYNSSSDGSRQALIAHWDGTSWIQESVPRLGDNAVSSVLTGVSATFASDIWAVGRYRKSDGTRHTLILHYDGTGWIQVASPSPGSSVSELSGVTALSANDAWAVGDGSNWTQQPSPTPDAGGDELFGVTATSASDAWAAGSAADTSATTVVHWDGAGWTQATGTPPPPPPPPVTVPDLTGDNTTEASAALQAAGLVLGTVRTILDPACVSIGRVISQSPAPSATAPPGSAVVIWIGRRNPAHPCR